MLYWRWGKSYLYRWGKGREGKEGREREGADAVPGRSSKGKGREPFHDGSEHTTGGPTTHIHMIIPKHSATSTRGQEEGSRHSPSSQSNPRSHLISRWLADRRGSEFRGVGWEEGVQHQHHKYHHHHYLGCVRHSACVPFLRPSSSPCGFVCLGRAPGPYPFFNSACSVPIITKINKLNPNFLKPGRPVVKRTRCSVNNLKVN